ncbi:hypothetical protein [Prosthecobacter sp.]|uniref:hypothetical protein n=1 Tax=Prosthecobacter sp. TaxID=1965333 RepID=UPI003783A32F
MSAAAFLTHGTAAASFAAYVIALTLRLNTNAPRRTGARIWWTIGCLVLLMHVACAFHFVHHWSHGAAFEATAQQTAAVTGFGSGSGLWVNYAVLALWLGDVCWWWLAPARHESRSRRSEWLLQGFLAFIWFNATVVFGHGMTRWLGGVAFLWLMALAWQLKSRNSPS